MASARRTASTGIVVEGRLLVGRRSAAQHGKVGMGESRDLARRGGTRPAHPGSRTARSARFSRVEDGSGDAIGEGRLADALRLRRSARHGAGGRCAAPPGRPPRLPRGRRRRIAPADAARPRTGPARSRPDRHATSSGLTACSVRFCGRRSRKAAQIAASTSSGLLVRIDHHAPFRLGFGRWTERLGEGTGGRRHPPPRTGPPPRPFAPAAAPARARPISAGRSRMKVRSGFTPCSVTRSSRSIKRLVDIARRALIGPGRIREAVAQDMGAAPEGRNDGLDRDGRCGLRRTARPRRKARDAWHARRG